MGRKPLIPHSATGVSKFRKQVWIQLLVWAGISLTYLFLLESKPPPTSPSSHQDPHTSLCQLFHNFLCIRAPCPDPPNRDFAEQGRSPMVRVAQARSQPLSLPRLQCLMVAVWPRSEASLVGRSLSEAFMARRSPGLRQTKLGTCEAPI